MARDAVIGSILSIAIDCEAAAMRDLKRWEKVSEFWQQLVQFGYLK